MSWKHHVSDIAIKLNRANALLFKIRNFVNASTVKTIYYAIFDSHINYANVIWAQNFNPVNRVSILQTSTDKLFKHSFRTNIYGKNSIAMSPVNAWNKIQTVFENAILKNLTTTQNKTFLSKKQIEKY